MLASFVLAIREGLEVALIVSILLVTVKKLGQEEGNVAIWSGTGLAVLVSIVIGIILNLIGASFEGRAEEIFEGITMILAAGILTWVILWMRKQSSQINQKIEGDIKKALLRENKLALFSLAFLAVIREGVELAFFLTAVAIDTDPDGVLIGASLGLISVIVFAVLLFNRLIRLDLKRFFNITSIILILFAAGLVAHGVHELNEVGWIPPLIEHVWDINHILDERSTIGELLKTLFGYNGNPSLTEILAYFMYFVILGITGLRLKNVKLKKLLMRS